ncbi:MAG TPA: MOSC domain-containing protein [Pyrinomonadaceae bacterium]|jgi:MOSC domain-containing protein YiiM|nr:MOSC domain-containing protein [Pyrinomonadaceae bacterium]
MTGYVYQLNCSPGGVPKLAVAEAELTRTGLVGDVQAKPLIHGGPERALSLYSLELIESLRAEGHPVSPGSAGENVTVAGLDWSRLAPGARLAIGDEVVVEISGYANPCPTIRGSFTGGEFKRISQKLRPGESRLYARVVRAGRIAAGQPIRVLDGDELAGGAGTVRPAAGSKTRAAKLGRVASTLASLAGGGKRGAA